ncbi:hypothetical protein EZV62_000679 [Acer yangbiense]|uniref:Pentacotripeptide-repeat region of PRORP domain-containing protein n=1 Tax=Acer yangbiense TaxID=1000413 RepID=A0A5C7IRZ6_9ROSI|nr:hypothetical protein EZV62_000679 [Acer yangbiense]
MLAKHKFLKLFRCHHSQKNLKIKPLRHLISNPFCTATESPELSSWIKSSDSQKPGEDFVIPSLASWVESYKLHDQTRLAGNILSEKTDTDINRFSKILKNRYPSPDGVVQALNGSSLNASTGLIEQILRRFSNDLVPALGVFIWAKTQTGYRHTPEIYNSMVDILGKCKKFDLMWDLVREMNDLNDGYVTLATMGKIIRRLARGGKYDEAVEAFRGLDKFGVTKDAMAMNLLMDALAKEKSVELAYEVFCEFKGCTPLNIRTFNILIDGWCKARKLENAERTMDEMKKHGFLPNVISYTCFIEHYCHEKDFRKVDEILKEMQENGCKPNAVTYTIALHALGKAKQINEALEVYAKMKSDGCLPDATFYSSLIFILRKAGRIKDANEIFEDMKTQGVMPDVSTYTNMISSACELSQEEDALKLLRKMEEDSCKPNLKTYAPLLKMCCKKRRMKVLNFLLIHMFRNDVSIDTGTYTLLVRGLCMSKKLELACSFFEEMVSKGMVPLNATYKMLVEELNKNCMGEAKEQIEKLMSRMKPQESI